MIAALPDDILDELRVLVNTVLLPGGGSFRAWRRSAHKFTKPFFIVQGECVIVGASHPHGLSCILVSHTIRLFLLLYIQMANTEDKHADSTFK